MLKTITSMEEFERRFFPGRAEKIYEQKLFREGTPEEIGKYLAQKSIDKVMKYLED